jgi:hypothetical protein
LRYLLVFDGGGVITDAARKATRKQKISKKECCSV